MKDWEIEKLLRYALSGGIGLAVLLLRYPAVRGTIGGMEAGKEATLVLGLVLLIGTLVYNLHRALVYPALIRLLGWFALRWKFSWRLLNAWKPLDAELEIDRWRWGCPDDKRRRWDEWGAQVHFLYCSAWGILAALLLGNLVWGTPDGRVPYIFWILFAVILFAGCVNNYRLLYSILADMDRQS